MGCFLRSVKASGMIPSPFTRENRCLIAVSHPADIKFSSTFYKRWRIPKAEPLAALRRERNSPRTLSVGRIFGGELQNIPVGCFARGPLLQEKRGLRFVPDVAFLCFSARKNQTGQQQVTRFLHLFHPRRFRFPLPGKRRGVTSGARQKNFFSCKKFFSLQPPTGSLQIHFSKMRPTERGIPPIAMGVQGTLSPGPLRFFEKNRVKLLCPRLVQVRWGIYSHVKQARACVQRHSARLV